jgi:hypothetical protein
LRILGAEDVGLVEVTSWSFLGFAVKNNSIGAKPYEGRKIPTPREAASALRAGSRPLPNPRRLFGQQPQRRDTEAPQRIMPRPIDQRRVIVHAQPIVELSNLQQRSNAIGDIDRQPD